MTSYLNSMIVMGVFIAAAHALNCRQCPIGLFGTCLFPKEVTCDNSTEQCYSGDAQFNATGALKLHTRGCLNVFFCNNTLTSSLLGAAYTSSFSCCNSDLCNGATTTQLPLTVAILSALLSSLWCF